MDCPIWKTICADVGSNDVFAFVDSARAGGKYKLYGSAQHLLLEASTKQKLLLTSWLVRQHRAGVSVPDIDVVVMEGLRTMIPMTFTEKVNAALLFIANTTDFGVPFFIGVNPSNLPQSYMLLAHTECTDFNQADGLLKTMIGMGLLGITEQQGFFLKADGWLRVEDLQTKAVASAQVFVAMWFDETMTEPYANGIEKALYDSGYDPRRVDQKHHHLNKVDDEIIAEIRRSRFLVADFTCAPNQVRGGVYFEAGFAMGLNIPIIWTCKATSLNDLHFDTRQYPHIPWKDSADLYLQLKARIGALIGEGPKRRLF
jgi:hypothetical protein